MPIHNSSEMTRADRRRCNGTRGSRRRCADRAAAATRRIAGPIQNARTSDPSAADPTHHHAATPLQVTLRGRADGRSGADVRRQHGRKDQPGSEPAAGDEEVGAVAYASAEPQAERHQPQRVHAEDRRVAGSLRRSRSGGVAGHAGRLADGADDRVGHHLGGELADRRRRRPSPSSCRWRCAKIVSPSFGV